MGKASLWYKACIGLVIGSVAFAVRAAPDRATPNLAAADRGGPSDTSWKRLFDQLKSLGDRMLPLIERPDDRQLRAELDQLMLGVLMHGYLDLVVSDPDQPMLMPGYGLAMNYAAPNGDTLYYHSRIDGAGVYRLSGTRGTVPIVNIGVGDQWYQMLGKLTPRKDFNLDSLTIDGSGHFSVIMSAERPSGYTGDWWQIPATSNNLGVRQVSNDWAREMDTQLSIERIDRPVNIPRRTAADLQRQIADLPTWVEHGTASFLEHVKAVRARPANSLHVFDPSGGGGLPGQSYYDGLFRIAADEALILDAVPPPGCKYWSVLLTDELFATVDWMNHQSSINGAQARLDADGHSRAVIALSDPGVANWLDPGGHFQGFIQGRWLGCKADGQPTLTKVPLADLRQHLPADTAFITPAERDESLRQRKRAFQARRWW